MEGGIAAAQAVEVVLGGRKAHGPIGEGEFADRGGSKWLGSKPVVLEKE